jgi:hypothetical protein
MVFEVTGELLKMERVAALVSIQSPLAGCAMVPASLELLWRICSCTL